MRARRDAVRESYSRSLAIGTGLSVLVHLGLGLAAAAVTVRPAVPPRTALTAVRLPPHEAPARASAPKVRLPPPAEPILRPARPVVASEISPDEPVYIPHDVAPVLVNAADVRRLIRDRYSPNRQPRVANSVVLWLFVNRAGDVEKLQLRRSSGSAELDALAEDAARAMRYRPALHRGRTVAVWVAQQIRFASEGTAEGGPTQVADRS